MELTRASWPKDHGVQRRRLIEQIRVFPFGTILWLYYRTFRRVRLMVHTKKLPNWSALALTPIFFVCTLQT